MKHLTFIISTLVLFCTRLMKGQTPYEDVSVTPEYQPFLNAGQVPLPGDIPVLNRKIFRATRVTSQEHPYMASIRRVYSHYSCGVILSKNSIITVAHPLDGVPIDELGVVVGENYNDRGGAIIPAILIVVHEDFNPYTLTADLAIIRVYISMSYRVNIKSVIAIAGPGQQFESDTVFVTGWGRCDLTGKELCLPRSSQFYPDEKSDPMLKTITIKWRFRKLKDSCLKLYKSVFGIQMDKNTLCLGYPREQFPTSPCMAVPGAAALVDAKLVGLQSWGFGCGYMKDLPIVYTDLRKYYNWIKNTSIILREVKTSNLTMLYKLTVAKNIYDWFSKTRVRLPKMPHFEETEIQQLQFDDDLSMIAGKVYDIRDYVLDGRFHEGKQRSYKNKRQTEEKLQKLKEIYSKLENYDIEPFISHTVPSYDDDSDTGDNPN